MRAIQQHFSYCAPCAPPQRYVCRRTLPQPIKMLRGCGPPVSQPLFRCCPGNKHTLSRAARSNLRAAEADKASSTADAKKAETMIGISTLLQELRGLDFPRDEVLLYVRRATKPPKGMPTFDMRRAADALELVLRDEVPAITDAEALEAVKLILSDLWRWRRRGGESWRDDVQVHELALSQLQGVTVAPEPDRVSSVLLDGLAISDKEKTEVGNALQSVAVASIQSFVWGGVVFTLAFLVFFNFVLRGG